MSDQEHEFSSIESNADFTGSSLNSNITNFFGETLCDYNLSSSHENQSQLHTPLVHRDPGGSNVNQSEVESTLSVNETTHSAKSNLSPCSFSTPIKSETVSRSGQIPSNENRSEAGAWSTNVNISLNTSDDSNNSLLCEIQSARNCAASEKKLQEFNALLEQVNEAFAKYKTSEFFVQCAKESTIGVPERLKNTVQEVLENPRVRKQVKCRIGGSLNILGLKHEFFKKSNEKVLSPLEKIEFNKHMTHVVVKKVDGLKRQQEIVHDIFREKNSSGKSTKLKEMQNSYQQVLNALTEQVEKSRDLLYDTHKEILDEEHLRKDRLNLLKSYQELQQYKIEYISDSIRSLHLKLENEKYKDPKFICAVNTYGFEMKMQVSNLRDELDKLKKALDDYKEKENSSQKYKLIVQEYLNTKRVLQLKQLFLKKLVDLIQSVDDNNHLF